MTPEQIQSQKLILIDRVKSYANEVILSNMNEYQQRNALALAISTMYKSLKDQGYFANAAPADIATMDYMETLWTGAAQIRQISNAVEAQINASTTPESMDVIAIFNSYMTV